MTKTSQNRRKTKGKAMKKTVVFCIGHSDIAVLIPYKNGKKYLKSPLGGNHATEKYKDLWYLINNGDWKGVDLFDTDGYLSISSMSGGMQFYVKDNPGFLKHVKQCIKQVWPYVMEFKEDRELFYESVIVNDHKIIEPSESGDSSG